MENYWEKKIIFVLFFGPLFTRLPFTFWFITATRHRRLFTFFGFKLYITAITCREEVRPADMAVMVYFAIVRSERSVAILAPHRFIVFFCLLRCEWKHVHGHLEYDAYFSVLCHDVLIKYVHGVGTAVNKGWFLMSLVWSNAITAETTHVVLVKNTLFTFFFLYWGEKTFEIANKIKRNGVLFLFGPEF